MALDKKIPFVEHSAVRTPHTLVSKLHPKLTDQSGDSQNGQEQKHQVLDENFITKMRQSIATTNANQHKPVLPHQAESACAPSLGSRGSNNGGGLPVLKENDTCEAQDDSKQSKHLQPDTSPIQKDT